MTVLGAFERNTFYKTAARTVGTHLSGAFLSVTARAGAARIVQGRGGEGASAAAAAAAAAAAGRV